MKLHIAENVKYLFGTDRLKLKKFKELHMYTEIIGES